MHQQHLQNALGTRSGRRKTGKRGEGGLVWGVCGAGFGVGLWNGQ